MTIEKEQHIYAFIIIIIIIIHRARSNEVCLYRYHIILFKCKNLNKEQIYIYSEEILFL